MQDFVNVSDKCGAPDACRVSVGAANYSRFVKCEGRERSVFSVGQYSAFCLSNNLQAMSAIEFQKQMKREYNLTIKTVVQDGKKVRVYCAEDEC